MRDGLWLLTIRKKHAFVPTMAQTEAGFYMGIEPVEVVDAFDKEALEGAMMRGIARGNPIVPTPTRATFPNDPLLRHAKVKSSSTFEKLARTWKLSKREGAYLIGPYKPGRDGGSVEDLDRMEAIPVDIPLQTVVHRLVERATQAQ